MQMEKRIRAKLIKAFAPASLDVIDESEAHKGHSGYREGGETHFRVVIKAAAFNGQTRVAQHRMVNATLADEFHDGVHALALTISGEKD